MAARAYIGPVALGVGDRPLSPVGGAIGTFFFQGPHCEFEEKKITLKACRPIGATGDIFEIFQNGHIFLKFLFLKNIKKKKAPAAVPL